MDLLSGMNPQQREAAQHRDGPALVLAGAGSGKTRVIVYRIAHLIRVGASRPENILAVTFTNKAAKEMQERVDALLGATRSSEPLISTFHSFCVRLLRREIHLLGYRRDFSIYDSDDQNRLMKHILKDCRLKEDDLTPKSVLNRVSYAKNHQVSPRSFATRFPSPDAEDIEECYTLYEQRLKQANALDFDDLLLKAVEVLDKHPERRDYYSESFRYILVDEYQDTNRPQYNLLRQLTARHRNLFVVGDEDQSIYKFRGADISNILNFERDFPGTRLIKLEQNYRSTQNILRVAGSVVENNMARKGKTLWTENHPGDVATCYRALSARSEAIWTTQRIKEYLDRDPECRIAVLYRTNFLSRNFEDVLLGAQIPYAVVGSVGFFNRMEVKDLLAYLRVIFNPEDDIALLRIINVPARGIGDKTITTLTGLALEKQIPVLHALKALVEDTNESARLTRPLMNFWQLVQRWDSLRDQVSISQLLQAILRDTGYHAMLEKQGTAEEASSRLANIEELIRAASESQERGETVFEFLDRASLSSELDRYDPNSRVVLMTLHSAKGLEFDIVFLAGLEEGLFPHSLSMNSKEELEEERRLCYVGITRARKKLFLSWTPFRRSFSSDSDSATQPSRFLSEMPPELVEGLEQESGYRYVTEEEEVYTNWWQVAARISAEKQKRESTGSARSRSPFAPASDAAETRATAKPLRDGMRVRHFKFGDGIVLRREKLGTEFKVTVLFSRAGKKTLLERFAKLQPI